MIRTLVAQYRPLTSEFESVIVLSSMAIAANREEASLTQAAPARPQALSAPKDDLLALARAAAGGEPNAARTLMTAVAGGMLCTVRKVLGTQHPDVDDVMQDAVVAFISALREFRGDCYVAHFANRVAVLTAMAARRRSRTRARFIEPDVCVGDAEDVRGASPFADTLASRRRALVRGLLDDLSEPIAEAVALHFLLGYTVDEIAAAAAVPVNTVWSRLRLGKQRLRSALTDERLAEELGGCG